MTRRDFFKLLPAIPAGVKAAAAAPAPTIGVDHAVGPSVSVMQFVNVKRDEASTIYIPGPRTIRLSGNDTLIIDDKVMKIDDQATFEWPNAIYIPFAEYERAWAVADAAHRSK